MINIVFILLKQSKDESKCSPLERKDTTKDLSESTKEQKKSDGEGKFYSLDAFHSVERYLNVSDPAV